MKGLYASLFVVLCLNGCHIDQTSGSNQKRPNIILVVADDLGRMDLGFLGNPVYETPNLNRIASQGAVFKNAYAADPGSIESRYGIATGNRYGVDVWATRGYTRSLSDILRQEGYTTFSIGRRDKGQESFENSYNTKVGGGVDGLNSYFGPFNIEGLEVGPGEYLTDVLTEKAIEYIQTAKAPFFMNFSFYAVGKPYEPKPELLEKYRSKIGNDIRYSAEYGAMVENLDHNIGLLLEALEDRGIFEQTLFIFTSDNGGISEISSQFPFRDGKGSFYEGGLRVPLLMYWPGTIPGTYSIETPVTGLDIYPTMLELLGFDQSVQTAGVSLVPLLIEGGEIPERNLVWRDGQVIVRGHWKFHDHFEDGHVELYDLSNDIREQTDVSAEHLDIVEMLTRDLPGSDLP